MTWVEEVTGTEVRGVARPTAWLRDAEIPIPPRPHTVTCTQPPSLYAWMPASEALEINEP